MTDFFLCLGCGTVLDGPTCDPPCENPQVTYYDDAHAEAAGPDGMRLKLELEQPRQCDRCAGPIYLDSPVREEEMYEFMYIFHASKERDCYGMMKASAEADTCFVCWDSRRRIYGCRWKSGRCNHDCHGPVPATQQEFEMEVQDFARGCQFCKRNVQHDVMSRMDGKLECLDCWMDREGRDIRKGLVNVR